MESFILCKRVNGIKVRYKSTNKTIKLNIIAIFARFNIIIDSIIVYISRLKHIK